jgi:hypothetical protein
VAATKMDGGQTPEVKEPSQHEENVSNTNHQVNVTLPARILPHTLDKIGNLNRTLPNKGTRRTTANLVFKHVLKTPNKPNRHLQLSKKTPLLQEHFSFLSHQTPLARTED